MKLPKIPKAYKTLFQPFRGYLYCRPASSNKYPDCCWKDLSYGIRINDWSDNFNLKLNNWSKEVNKDHAPDIYIKNNYKMYINRVETMYYLVHSMGKLIFAVLHNKLYNAKLIDFLPDYSYNKIK